METIPELREFRVEWTGDGILHLIFDMPDRTMNVFSNAAIHEIDAFAGWLKGSDVKGVVVRSGKPAAFCVGADLGELGIAYDMIMAVTRERRFEAARDHFAPIGRAFRKLEMSGKPVAAAINGLALGGGCEFALGCHYRVMTDTPQTALGLPESLVGLLPGGGGTQRLPRLVGVEASLPVLMEGARYSPREAVACGAAHEVVPPGHEVAAAEYWLRSRPVPRQPWDDPSFRAPARNTVCRATDAVRRRVLAQTHGHYPAPLAILDCVEQGLPESIDRAISIELGIFAGLIQRPEPRNMIHTMFLGRVDYDRRRRGAGLPPQIEAVKVDVAACLLGVIAEVPRADIRSAWEGAGFTKDFEDLRHDIDHVPGARLEDAGPGREGIGLWFETPESKAERLGARLIVAAVSGASRHLASLDEDLRRLADYAILKDFGFPAYLGGPFALLAYLGTNRLRAVADHLDRISTDRDSFRQ